MTVALAAAVVIGSFFAGAIPFGILISRAFYRRDIRAAGSGNIGAANALRTLGKRGAVAVLVLDGLKGALAVVAGRALGGDGLAVAAALAAVAGHCFSPFLHFRGGKGVATNFGAVIALAWPAGIAFGIVWLAAVTLTGFASLGSMLASIAMLLVLGFFIGLPGTIYGGLSAILIVVMHRANLARLRAGTENTLSLFARKSKA